MLKFYSSSIQVLLKFYQSSTKVIPKLYQSSTQGPEKETLEKLMREAAEALPVSGETEIKKVMIVDRMLINFHGRI